MSEEDTSLERLVAEKLFGTVVRALIIGAGASLMTHLTPDQAATVKDTLTVFADSTTQLVVGAATIGLGVLWSAWEKFTAVKETQGLKSEVRFAKNQLFELKKGNYP